MELGRRAAVLDELGRIVLLLVGILHRLLRLLLALLLLDLLLLLLLLRCDVGQFVRVELILALLAYEKYVFGPDLNWHGSKLACEVMPGVASHPWLLVYGALTAVPVGR